jgi:hypothetical protein
VHEVRDLRLELPFLSNLPDDLEVRVEPRFGFVFSGSPFDAQGHSKPFAKGRASSFALRFDRLDLNPLWAYLPAALPVQPVGGSLSSDLTLDFEQRDDAGAQVRLAGQVELRELALRERGGPAVLGWQNLRLRLAEVQPLQGRVGLETLQLDGLQLQVQREPDGRLNLQRLAAAAAPAASAPAASAAAVPGSGASSGAASSSSPSASGRGWVAQLARLEVNGARVAWRDQALQPAAELQVEPIDLRLTNLRWPVDAPADLQLDARLVAAGRPAGTVHVDGTLDDRQAQLGWRYEGLDLGAAAPYLRGVLRPVVAGRSQGNGTVDWAAGEVPRLIVQAADLALDELRLTEPGTGRRATAPLQLARLEIAGARADLLQRQVVVESLLLQRPAVELARDRDGVLNVQRWRAGGEPATAAAAPAPAANGPVSGASTPAPAAATPGAEWRLELRRFRLDGGRIRFTDAALPASPLQLAAVRAGASDLAWPLGTAPVPTQFAAQFSAAGSDAAARIDWNGRVGQGPLQARGRLLLERFPAHVFEPYFADRLPLTLRRLEAGFRGEVDLRQAGAEWAARVRGDALLADLRVGTGPGDDDDLVRWNALAAGGLDLNVVPGAKPLLQIESLRLQDYASRVVITEDGQLNLQTAAAGRKPGAAPAAAAASGAAASSAPSAASAPPADTVSAPVAALAGLPIDFVVGATQIVNASVDFNDRFVRPNYRAQLTELNGTLGRLDSRTRDAATLKLEGRVAGTGLLQIEGALNPAVRPPALDLKAKAHDIELPGLTPYSAKYAGYPIERGKLSVDVAYKIEADGKLDASNRIVVDQLTFGPKTDSPQATKLPVKLAVALLQDANGVIDLDLPITGSLEDPQFSIGALIWKVIVNLLNKALSSPFSLLGGSGGKDLSVVPFEPGTAQLGAGAAPQLDAVVKAMTERPTLRLTIVGEADFAREQDAMRRAALEQRLRDEQRRDRARGSLGSSAGAADAPLPPLTADERARLIRRVYDDTKLPDKPRNLIGLAKDIPVEQMEAMLLAALTVDEASARAIAQQRGRGVRDALLAKGLPGQRLFLAEAKDPPAAADNGAWSPRARLLLGVE